MRRCTFCKRKLTVDGLCATCNPRVAGRVPVFITKVGTMYGCTLCGTERETKTVIKFHMSDKHGIAV